MVKIRAVHTGDCKTEKDCKHCEKISNLTPVIQALFENYIYSIFNDKDFLDLSNGDQYIAMRTIAVTLLTILIQSIEVLDLRVKASEEILEMIEDTFNFHCTVENHSNTH